MRSLLSLTLTTFWLSFIQFQMLAIFVGWTLTDEGLDLSLELLHATMAGGTGWDSVTRIVIQNGTTFGGLLGHAGVGRMPKLLSPESRDTIVILGRKKMQDSVSEV